MLPKNNRLKQKKDFTLVFKRGKGFKADTLFLKVIGNNLDKSRFGIIVTTKTSKKANTRNKIRRRIKAIIFQKLPQIKNKLDVVLSTRPGIENKDFRETEAEITKIFEKAKIFT